MLWNKYFNCKKKNSINNNNYRINNNSNRHEQSPPDLEELFHNIYLKLSNLLKRKSNSNTQHKSSKNNNYIILVIITFIVIWISSGFYTIKEAERGLILRFGKFDHLVHPGLNWKPTFVDKLIKVNVESVRELATSGMMLTSDENVVYVEMNVQYRVIDPKNYLFSVTNADDSLRQATDSALRGVIGKYTMDRILTEGRTIIRNDTQHTLEDTIDPYNMGITLLDVNFQTARPPEEVKAAFDDAIAARENEQQYIREAEAYSNEVQPRANGKAQRILEEARAYKARVVLEAQGEIQQFAKILLEYKRSPKITCERLYVNTMEKILSNTNKILINNNSNLILLPIDRLIHNKELVNNKEEQLIDKNILLKPSSIHNIENVVGKIDNNIKLKNKNQLRENIKRDSNAIRMIGDIN